MKSFFELKSKYNVQYELVQKAIPVVTNHWDFWSNVVSFGNSCSNGVLVRTPHGWWRYRKGMEELKLITYDNLEEIQKEIAILGRKYIVRTLARSWKIPPKDQVLKENDFYIDVDFDFEFRYLKSKHRGNIKRVYKAGEKKYIVQLARQQDELVTKTLFKTWVEWAEERHANVFKAHYKQWLQLYFKGVFEKNAYLFCFWDNNDLIAMTGFEIIGKKGMLLIVKHKREVSPEYVWLWTLQKCKELGADTIFCGSTAETLKRRLGFKEIQTWAFPKIFPVEAGEVEIIKV